MKKFLVFTLVLTTIFPAYCFATPQRIIPTDDEILEGIMLIIEDGIVEEEEVTSFIEKFNAAVIPTSATECLVSVSLISIGLLIVTLNVLDFSGNSLEILFNIIILYAQVRKSLEYFYRCFVLP